MKKHVACIYVLVIAGILAMSSSCVYAAQVTEQNYRDNFCNLVYPKIEIADNRQAADKINSVIQAHVDEAKRAVQSANAVTVILSYKTMLNDKNLYSITMNFYYMPKRAAHGTTARSGLVFDLKTGNLLSWSDLYPKLNPNRCALMNQAILQQGQARNIAFFTPFKGVSANTVPNFYVNADNKPVLIFQPYELAPYVYSVLEFEMPPEVYENQKASSHIAR